jgi:hypothetical protein
LFPGRACGGRGKFIELDDGAGGRGIFAGGVVGVGAFVVALFSKLFESTPADGVEVDDPPGLLS